MPVVALTAARTRTSGGRSRRRHRLAAITEVLALTLSAVFILVPTAAASDPTLVTRYNPNSGWVYRRLKHFSGYNVVVDFYDDGSGLSGF